MFERGKRRLSYIGLCCPVDDFGEGMYYRPMNACRKKRNINKKIVFVVVFLSTAGLVTAAQAVVSISPDGTGTYVGGLPSLSPYGAYVGGTPTITPEGFYVDGAPQKQNRMAEGKKNIKKGK